MIVTLFVTIIIEGIVVIVYSIWRRKPIVPVLFTSVIANLITQSLLWIVLNVFFQSYLIVLFVAEILIWLLESLLLSYFPANKLRFADAILIAFLMNLASFALGWFLPV